MVDCVKAGGAKEIGAIIRSIRKSRDLSQTEMARLMGCAQNTISRYEAGESVPCLRLLRGILA